MNLKAHEKISREFYPTKTSAKLQVCVGKIHKVENYFGNFHSTTMNGVGLLVYYFYQMGWNLCWSFANKLHSIFANTDLRKPERKKPSKIKKQQSTMEKCKY